MVEGKVKFALWFAPETRELVSANYRQDNCKSMSEFIEKAVLFYCGYLQACHAEYYLPRVLGSVLQGTLACSGIALAGCCSSRRWNATSQTTSWPPTRTSIWTPMKSFGPEVSGRCGRPAAASPSRMTWCSRSPCEPCRA